MELIVIVSGTGTQVCNEILNMVNYAVILIFTSKFNANLQYLEILMLLQHLLSAEL